MARGGGGGGSSGGSWGAGGTGGASSCAARHMTDGRPFLSFHGALFMQRKRRAQSPAKRDVFLPYLKAAEPHEGAGAGGRGGDGAAPFGAAAAGPSMPPLSRTKPYVKQPSRCMNVAAPLSVYLSQCPLERATKWGAAPLQRPRPPSAPRMACLPANINTTTSGQTMREIPHLMQQTAMNLRGIR